MHAHSLSSPFSNTLTLEKLSICQHAWGRPVWEMDKMQGYGGVVGNRRRGGYWEDEADYYWYAGI